MNRITLAGTDLSVSRLCFGNMTFGGQTEEEAAARMLDCCLDRGINFLDTASVCNKGAAEEMLGKLLGGRRQRVVPATKVRNSMGAEPDHSVPVEETPETIEQLVRQGKVRYPATSNYASWQVCRMVWLSNQNGWRPARGLGVTVVAYNPLAGGLLTGKQKRETPLPGRRFDNATRIRVTCSDRCRSGRGRRCSTR